MVPSVLQAATGIASRARTATEIINRGLKWLVGAIVFRHTGETPARLTPLYTSGVTSPLSPESIKDTYKSPLPRKVLAATADSLPICRFREALH